MTATARAQGNRRRNTPAVIPVKHTTVVTATVTTQPWSPPSPRDCGGKKRNASRRAAPQNVNLYQQLCMRNFFVTVIFVAAFLFAGLIGCGHKAPPQSPPPDSPRHDAVKHPDTFISATMTTTRR